MRVERLTIVRKSCTRSLAEFVASASFDSLPEGAVHAAKRCVLDTIGVMLGGSATELGREIRDFVVGFEGKPQATVLGSGDRISCGSAAYVNGVFGKIDDFDDGHRLLGMCHLGPTVVPASLAVGEWLGKSGRELIVAIAMGYEVGVRVGAAMDVGRRMRLEVNNPNTTCGIMGAATAVAKLLGLGPDRIQAAWNVAACEMPRAMSLDDDHVSSLRAVSIGSTARTGVLAALMAEDLSVVGSGLAFEGDDGYCAQVSGVCRKEKLVENLGGAYHIGGIYLKPFPSCRYTHPAITALLKLVAEHRVTPREVERIVVRVGREARGLDCSELRAEGLPLHELQVRARFSIPYVVAVALINGRLGIEHFEKEFLTGAEVKALMKKIRVLHEPKYDLMPLKMPAQVRVEMMGGGIHTSEVEYPKGEPEDALSEEEVRQKFRNLASRVLPVLDVALVERDIEQLERMRDIRDLMRDVVASDTGAARPPTGPGYGQAV